MGDNEFWIVFVVGNSIGLQKMVLKQKIMLDCGVFCNSCVAIVWFRKLISWIYVVWDDYLF